ncbi:class I adenylate-forming enzyme family protein [Nocardioides panzhihuensis]|uniref:Acyl-CoA synthetase (AMP-forming)/AMP-acid ligase II n=1 Tax=Nocardioides panzhihuensis TaxID=860243 RepID=A0A7Z0DHA8_9ACTN|nr:class I adenylate-forming enzyme family protein [Nocardioides panzhihuensis]NYI75554.1 acyl-CoA synthetase (AMP-forming)/AMP-acid ligase II [Nocardioides panzhihuensis]
MNLTMLLDMACDGFGDRVVVGRRESGLTAAQLRNRAARGAELAQEAEADSIIYLAVNGPAFPVAMFAAAYAGIPLVPLNYRLGVEQLDQLLANHPKAFVIAHEGAHSIIPAGRTVTTPESWLADTDAPTAAGSEPIISDDAAVVIYTSGTTSAPKGVLLRHENLVSYVFGSVEFASAEATSAALMSVPPYHIAAVANVITNLYAGRRFIVLEQFTPVEWLELVRDQAITNALVVPTMLLRILESEAEKSVPSLQSLAYGGAPMPGAVIERAMDTWPTLDFVNAYGLTETSSTVAVLGPDDHRAAYRSQDPFERARLGSVGRALPGIELEIRGPLGDVQQAGHKGRIFLRGDQVSAEYAGIGKQLDERGFFDTRDEGFLDDEGYLFIGGRSDDTIIRGAENIAPAEIESVLQRHPAIVDVAVVGVPDEEWGQRIVAAAVLRDGMNATSDELREFVRSALRSSKTPDEFVFWPELPRTETGKLVRRNVVRQFQTHTAQPAH